MASRRRLRPSGSALRPRRDDRDALISDLEASTVSRRFPRVQLTLLVAGAGLAGFLTSVALLRAGVDAMAVRYAIAVASGYLAFLGLIQIWIVLHSANGISDVADVGVDSGDDIAEPWSTALGGGRSGGGGGGAAWGDARGQALMSQPRPHGAGRTSGGRWFDGLSVDADDAVWLVVAGILVCAAGLAVGYVIYIAPALLAEVMLDAALVTTVYRRLRPQDAQHWSVGVLRRTWAPALVMVLCLAGAGYAMQRMAPEARSIGGVLAHLSR